MVCGPGDGTIIYPNINNIKASHLVKYGGSGEQLKRLK